MIIMHSESAHNVPKHQSENDGENIYRCFKAGKRLYNARGTDGDVIKIKGKEFDESIDAWKEYCENCSSKVEVCPNRYCKGNDSQDIVGAHVTLEKSNEDLHRGDKVYIIPLCRSCNSSGIDMKIELKHEIKALSLLFDKNLVKTKCK